MASAEELPAMVTNIENVAAQPVTASPDTLPARGLWARAIDHLQSAVCGLHGHDPLLVFEDGRMFLRCTSCGYESPGWNTGEKRPRQRFSGDAARHQMQPPEGTRVS
jgi:hypothetical protein